MVSFQDFLTTESFEGFEDAAKFETWKPDIESYRRKLAEGLPSEYKIDLPKPVDKLIEEKFNAIEYLKAQNVYTKEESDIVKLPVADLLSKIANGDLKSVDVLKAFARRAVIAHQFTNCLADIFIDEGIKRAEYLDEYLAKNGKTIGPFHGLPISLKEHLNYKGRITHASYVSMLRNIPESHGKTTQILEDLGAVFYVRTTTPQTLMHLDSNNNITGLTRNPFNLSLSSGGSSSGEGALIPFDGSPIGIGSDIGGSIRAPAAFCDLYGLKPTTLRVTGSGGVSGAAGNESVVGTLGPMTRRIDDLDLWYQIYINEGKPWERDCNTIFAPWRKVETPKPSSLKIAVMYDDGVIKPTPPIRRGLDHVVSKLKEAGVEIVSFDPIKVQEAYDTVNKFYSGDGNQTQKNFLSASGEPLVKLTKWNLNFGNGSKGLTVFEERQLNKFKTELKTEYHDYLDKNGIDFILGPVFYNTAPPSETSYSWSYTCLYNFLDLPALSFKLGLFVDTKIDKWPSEHTNYKYRSPLEELSISDYDPDLVKGAPIGLQLAGRRFRDEEVVAAGKAIAKILSLE
ncbi:uncharacterized protein PRCAT00000081001 [Priceomyces carsonii]|uniref:uncharacterized protein n=1 Tax=Priceomyces carsonii TaxID=28549 RepID=UPI002EDA9CB9|nr:unnamed protein product [Priceomyces carsonii]